MASCRQGWALGRTTLPPRLFLGGKEDGASHPVRVGLGLSTAFPGLRAAAPGASDLRSGCRGLLDCGDAASEVDGRQPWSRQNCRNTEAA